MNFSLIIPVFNRPNEIDELLDSLVRQDYDNSFEVVIVEDGSAVRCDTIIEKFKDQLQISYHYKENTGPGDSRNFGMRSAKGDYFIIFDSDCIIPSHYLKTVDKALNDSFVDCFGGPDKSLKSFSPVQKAIDFTMTSFLTTGGVRGGSEMLGKFQPRSFNMGISREAFEVSGGFGNIHPGEDPDLSMRLWDLGFKTRLIPAAYVYHKRRIDWQKFSKQVYKFGKVRPILNHWHPKHKKLTFYFPLLFVIVVDIAVILMFFGIFTPIILIAFYLMALMVMATFSTQDIKVGIMSGIAAVIQFYGYAIGFLESLIQIQWLKRDPEKTFPELFFKSGL